MLSRNGKISFRQGRAPQCQLGANVLAERASFAPFPRLELPAGDQMRGFVMLTGLIVERAQFDAQIIALLNEPGMSLQFAETFCRLFAKPFPKLVTFVKQPGVSWIGLECLVIGGTGFGRFG